MKVDYENNILEVPATGADDMTLAFVTDTRIDISSTEGAGSGTSVGNMSVSEEAEGIVSSFNVSVAAQGAVAWAIRFGAFEKCLVEWNI